MNKLLGNLSKERRLNTQHVRKWMRKWGAGRRAAYFLSTHYVPHSFPYAYHFSFLFEMVIAAGDVTMLFRCCFLPLPALAPPRVTSRVGS